MRRSGRTAASASQSLSRRRMYMKRGEHARLNVPVAATANGSWLDIPKTAWIPFQRAMGPTIRWRPCGSKNTSALNPRRWRSRSQSSMKKVRWVRQAIRSAAEVAIAMASRARGSLARSVRGNDERNCASVAPASMAQPAPARHALTRLPPASRSAQGRGERSRRMRSSIVRSGGNVPSATGNEVAKRCRLAAALEPSAVKRMPFGGTPTTVPEVRVGAARERRLRRGREADPEGGCRHLVGGNPAGLGDGG